jgi:hypothetical protein
MDIENEDCNCYDEHAAPAFQVRERGSRHVMEMEIRNVKGKEVLDEEMDDGAMRDESNWDDTKLINYCKYRP